MTGPRVVYDCNVFAQRLLSPKGPAARCVELAERRHVELFVSEYVLNEIEELYLKLLERFAVTAEDTADLADAVRGFSTLIDPVPGVYVHPIDPDDSPYVDLAIAAEASLIVSRDNHLLGLSRPENDWALAFQQRFANLQVMPPELFLAQYDSSRRQTPRD